MLKRNIMKCSEVYGFNYEEAMNMLANMPPTEKTRGRPSKEIIKVMTTEPEDLFAKLTNEIKDNLPLSLKHPDDIQSFSDNQEEYDLSDNEKSINSRTPLLDTNCDIPEKNNKKIKLTKEQSKSAGVAKKALAKEQAIAEKKLAKEQAIAEKALAKEQAIAEKALAKEQAIAEKKLAKEQAIAEKKLAKNKSKINKKIIKTDVVEVKTDVTDDVVEVNAATAIIDIVNDVIIDDAVTVTDVVTDIVTDVVTDVVNAVIIDDAVTVTDVVTDVDNAVTDVVTDVTDIDNAVNQNIKLTASEKIAKKKLAKEQAIAEKALAKEQAIAEKKLAKEQAIAEKALAKEQAIAEKKNIKNKIEYKSAPITSKQTPLEDEKCIQDNTPLKVKQIFIHGNKYLKSTTSDIVYNIETQLEIGKLSSSGELTGLPVVTINEVKYLLASTKDLYDISGKTEMGLYDDKNNSLIEYEYDEEIAEEEYEY